MTGVRPVAMLKVEQAELLKALAGESAATLAVAASPTVERAACMVGRVAQVVSEDETVGPHLVVVLQRFTGTPPAPEDATADTQVYYPWPGSSIGDFAENDLVLLIHAAGARLACNV